MARKKTSAKRPKAPKKRASQPKPAQHQAHGEHEKALREHLLYLLREGGAHVSFDQALTGFPADQRGAKVNGVPYSAWQILEHLRIAQWDIVEFSRNPKHVSPEWPGGYWPSSDSPPDDAAWEKALKSFHADLEAMGKLVGNPRTDLYARIPHGEGQTILREALLVADHNAYHLGQLVLLRRLLGAWKES